MLIIHYDKLVGPKGPLTKLMARYEADPALAERVSALCPHLTPEQAAKRLRTASAVFLMVVGSLGEGPALDSDMFTTFLPQAADVSDIAIVQVLSAATSLCAPSFRVLLPADTPTAQRMVAEAELGIALGLMAAEAHAQMLSALMVSGLNAAAPVPTHPTPAN